MSGQFCTLAMFSILTQIFFFSFLINILYLTAFAHPGFLCTKHRVFAIMMVLILIHDFHLFRDPVHKAWLDMPNNSPCILNWFWFCILEPWSRPVLDLMRLWKFKSANDFHRFQRPRPQSKDGHWTWQTFLLAF